MLPDTCARRERRRKSTELVFEWLEKLPVSVDVDANERHATVLLAHPKSDVCTRNSKEKGIKAI
jgi:hypothetical protein